MDVISTGRESRYLHTVERYHIYKISKNNLHINDVHIEVHNLVFQIIHKLYDR
jgi:hypothetical protein